jgi:hypothetical protein
VTFAPSSAKKVATEGPARTVERSKTTRSANIAQKYIKNLLEKMHDFIAF